MSLGLLSIPVVLLVLSLIVTVILVKKGVSAKRAMAIHFLSLIAIFVISIMLPIGVSAASADSSSDTQTTQTTQTEQTAQATQTTPTADSSSGWRYLGAALAVGLAGIGGGIAVAGGAPAAIGANVEDPKSFVKSLIFVALGESFGLYGLLISILCFVL